MVPIKKKILNFVQNNLKKGLFSCTICNPYHKISNDEKNKQRFLAVCHFCDMHTLLIPNVKHFFRQGVYAFKICISYTLLASQCSRVCETRRRTHKTRARHQRDKDRRWDAHTRNADSSQRRRSAGIISNKSSVKESALCEVGFVRERKRPGAARIKFVFAFYGRC